MEEDAISEKTVMQLAIIVIAMNTYRSRVVVHDIVYISDSSI